MSVVAIEAVTPHVDYAIGNGGVDRCSEAVTSNCEELCAVVEAGPANTPSCEPSSEATALIQYSNLMS